MSDEPPEGSTKRPTKPGKRRWPRWRRYLAATLLTVLLVGLLLPSAAIIPVKDATSRDWHPDTFWFEPWGESGVHKGIDIFAPRGTEVQAATSGIVIYTGSLRLGGNIVAILGPKWRLHFYAHLDSINVDARFVAGGEPIGSVGDTGNAKGKPPHLHYTVVSLIPLPWKASTETQGWKRMFYIDPAESFPR